MNDHLRPVYQQPIDNVVIDVSGFSLNQATPQLVAANDAQIDRDDASDDFLKEKLHANIRRSNIHAMTGPHDLSIDRVTAVIAPGATCFGVAGSGVGSIAGVIPVEANPAAPQEAVSWLEFCAA